MIRHSSSFSISLILHLVVVLLVVFLYNYVSSIKPPKRVSVNLSKCTIDCGCGCMANMERKPKRVEQPQEEPKKIEPKKVEKKAVNKQNEKKAVVKDERVVEPIVQPAQTVAMNKVQEQKEKLLAESKVEETSNTEQKEPSAEAPVQLSEENAMDTSVEDAKRVEDHKKAVQKRYVNENLSKIAQMLQENLYYPIRARKRRIEGDVVVKFTLLKNSEIKDVIIIKHSHDILDASAVKTIENLQGKLPAPIEDLVLEVPINYRLN